MEVLYMKSPKSPKKVPAKIEIAKGSHINGLRASLQGFQAGHIQVYPTFTDQKGKDFCVIVTKLEILKQTPWLACVAGFIFHISDYRIVRKYENQPAALSTILQSFQCVYNFYGYDGIITVN